MRARKLSGNKHTKNNRGKELHKSYSEKEKGRSCPFRDNSFKDIIEMSIKESTSDAKGTIHASYIKVGSI